MGAATSSAERAAKTLRISHFYAVVSDYQRDITCCTCLQVLSTDSTQRLTVAAQIEVGLVCGQLACSQQLQAHSCASYCVVRENALCALEHACATQLAYAYVQTEVCNMLYRSGVLYWTGFHSSWPDVLATSDYQYEVASFHLKLYAALSCKGKIAYIQGSQPEPGKSDANSSFNTYLAMTAASILRRAT